MGEKCANSGGHLDEIHQQGKDNILRAHNDVTCKMDVNESSLDMDITLHELKMATGEVDTQLQDNIN